MKLMSSLLTTKEIYNDNNTHFLACNYNFFIKFLYKIFFIKILLFDNHSDIGRQLLLFNNV